MVKNEKEKKLKKGNSCQNFVLTASKDHTHVHLLYVKIYLFLPPSPKIRH